MEQDRYSSELNRLKKLTQRNLVQFVESEFTVAHTVTGLAKTEVQLGNTKHERELLTKVGRAIAAVQEHLAEADRSEKQKADILRRLADLKPRLQAVRQQTERSLRKRSPLPLPGG